MSYLSTTQNSLPVAGQALLHGILTRKVPVKGFKGVDYISFPFPKLCLAQLHRPTQETTIYYLALSYGGAHIRRQKRKLAKRSSLPPIRGMLTPSILSGGFGGEDVYTVTRHMKGYGPVFNIPPDREVNACVLVQPDIEF